MYYAAFRGQHVNGRSRPPGISPGAGTPSFAHPPAMGDLMANRSFLVALMFGKIFSGRNPSTRWCATWAKTPASCESSRIRCWKRCLRYRGWKLIPGPSRCIFFLPKWTASVSASHRLRPETLRLMAKHFEDYRDQFEVFSEFPELDDTSIVKFINVASALDKISSHTLRGKCTRHIPGEHRHVADSGATARDPRGQA